MWTKLLGFIILTFSLTSCGGANDPSPRHTDIAIEISSEALSEIRGGGLNKPRVPVQIQVDGGDFTNCQASLSGNSTIDSVKLALNVLCRRPVFGDYFSFKLSPQAQDLSLIRTLTVSSILSRTNLNFSDTRPIELWINGRSLGFYLFIERVDEFFFRRRNISHDFLLKAKTGTATFREETRLDPHIAFDLEEGSFSFQSIIPLIDEAQGRLPLGTNFDLSNALDFYIYNLVSMNRDGVDNNYFLYSSQGKVFFVPWDWDRTLTNDFSKATDRILKQSPLLERLLENSIYFAQIRDQLQRFDNSFEPLILSEINEFQDQVNEILLSDNFIPESEKSQIQPDQQSVIQNFSGGLDFLQGWINQQ